LDGGDWTDSRDLHRKVAMPDHDITRQHGANLVVQTKRLHGRLGLHPPSMK
jgi:hypothetical protein